MKKSLFIPLLILAGCITSGLYGIIHNQITYTVSPDYFHQFKYHQFHIAPDLPGRIGASIIGWAASWWMGIIIGVFLVLIGLIVPGTRRYAFSVLRAYGIVALTALLIGLTALTIAFFVVTPDNAGSITRYGNLISDPVAFRRAGTMHNFSYIGGLLGVITGSAWLIYERKRAIIQGSGLHSSQ